MDDSDDYFVDDIALDDKTLARLDKEEQKYLTSQNNAFLDAPPVSKKRKTISGWRPGPGSHSDNADDDDNLPEISVHDDGTYGVRDVIRTSSPKNLLSIVDVDTSLGWTAATTKTQSGPTSSTNIQQQQSTGTRSGNLSIVPFQRPSPHSRQYLEQLQQLIEDNKRLQSALNEVTDLKLTKEGEVTILRDGMEKAARDHATQVARLKAAKEEGDAKQLQMQKEMKEEIERMKTQFTFKQQEMESTLRRVPPSARASRFSRDLLRTPVRRPSQAIGDTPMASRIYLEQNQSLEEQRIETPKGRRFVKSSKKSNLGNLPGFQNTFSQGNPPPSSPPSSPTIHLVRNLNTQGDDERADPYQHRSHAIIENDSDFIIMDEEDNIQEIEITGRPINWISELSRVILTHALPNSAQPTLQLLLATSILAVETDAVQFAAACSKIFEIIASSSKILDYTMTARSLCDPLATLLFVIGCSEQHFNIQSLINLLTTLVLSLPGFGSHLLQANENMQYILPAAVREIIIRHLGPVNKSDSLPNEILGLLEALCLRCQDNTMSRLAPLVKNGKVWAVLLRNVPSKSPLVRTCQLLVLLGSYPSLARELVDVSYEDGGRSTEPRRLFLIDMLCAFLYEENDGFNEIHAIREHILTFFATLSLSHPDSLTTLTDNDVLIPSLVCLLSNLTNPLWEDDEGLMTTPQDVAVLVRMTNQVVTLIHHLVLSVEPSFNLKLRLHHNSHQALTSLNHMFIVSFGRLCCADPPSWVDKSGKNELMSLTDMAQELLYLVVDGPESDSIWSLYQEDLDKDESEMDEGEIEARLMGD